MTSASHALHSVETPYPEYCMCSKPEKVQSDGDAPELQLFLRPTLGIVKIYSY